MGSEPADGVHGLEGDGGVGAAQLLHGPAGDEGVVAELHLGPLHGFAPADESDQSDEGGQGEEEGALAGRPAEVAAGGTQDEALDQVAVAAPEELCHGPAQ